MRKFASLVAAGALLLSSTAAFAAEGALAPGGAANVKQAQAEGLGALGTVAVVTVVVTVIVVVAVEANSSTATT